VRRSSDYAEVLQGVELDEPGSTEVLTEMVATGDRSASAITASATVRARARSCEPGLATGPPGEREITCFLPYGGLAVLRPE
jgi:hypothetical protein